MKTMLCSVLLCLFAFSPAVAQTENNKTEQEVLKVVDSVLHALVKRVAAAHFTLIKPPAPKAAQ